MDLALWILVAPISWFFIAKYKLQHTFNWKEMGISMAVVSLLVFAVIAAGKYGQTMDTEVWNGKVVSKDRDHGHYLRSYSCNCTTTCSGSGSTRSCHQTCQTCYEDRYTVTWSADTTVGDVTFQHLDRTSRSVYNTPDPSSYTRCKVGEPASLEKTYTNYVQAVPQSLFHDDSKVAEQYAGKIPSYPRVYDHYRFNRVLSVGAKVSSKDITQLDALLDNALISLGASKQANIIVILTNITDPSYRYAIENAWLGGEKNDIIVFVGLDGKEIIWADAMTWALNSGNELFQVTMRDEILNMGTFEVEPFAALVTSTVQKLYDRPHMTDYEYLADEIKPPMWVIILAIVLAFGSSAVLTYYFHKNEI